MTAVSTVVREALLHLGVVNAVQPIKAVNMADGIRALNLMMRAWEAAGWCMGWSDVANPSDDLPAPPELEELIGYALAVRLQSRFRISLDATIVAMVTAGEASLSAQVASQDAARTDFSDLPAGVGKRGGNGWRNGLNG